MHGLRTHQHPSYVGQAGSPRRARPHAHPAWQRWLQGARRTVGLALLVAALLLLRLQALNQSAAGVDAGPQAPARGQAAAAVAPRAGWTAPAAQRAVPAPDPLSAADGLALLRQSPAQALLLPLVDATGAPHWTDVALRRHCGPATQVRVDGQPLQPGAPLPARPFRLHWQMDRCRPLGPGGPLLSGGVLVTVFPAGRGAQLQVQPQQLRIGGAGTAAHRGAGADPDSRDERGVAGGFNGQLDGWPDGG